MTISSSNIHSSSSIRLHLLFFFFFFYLSLSPIYPYNHTPHPHIFSPRYIIIIVTSSPSIHFDSALYPSPLSQFTYYSFPRSLSMSMYSLHMLWQSYTPILLHSSSSSHLIDFTVLAFLSSIIKQSFGHTDIIYNNIKCLSKKRTKNRDANLKCNKTDGNEIE